MGKVSFMLIRRMAGKVKRYFEIKIYNKRHHTKIQSYRASLKAKYGKGVGIYLNTFVGDEVEIGDYSYVNQDSSLGNCVVGRYCSISSGVFISPWEHNLQAVSTHPFAVSEAYKNRKRPQTIIENDVLISLGVFIKEGVRIGTGAVVGAGAVVTKDVAPYEIVGGYRPNTLAGALMRRLGYIY